MRKRGKASLVVVAAAAAAVLAIVLLLTSGGSPRKVADDFMQALANQDAGRLAELTVIGEDDPATRRKKWEVTLQRGRHYVFTYELDSADEIKPGQAFARLRMVRNANQPGAVEERFAIPLVKVDGRWKVNAAEISRGMFPSLPRR